ncbi:MAG TPA: HAMP domain-containing sensor histidine kinase [Acidothermaceae bacterium]
MPATSVWREPASQRRRSLASRIILVTTIAAALAVLVAGVLSGFLLRYSAQAQGRQVLRDDASLAATATDLSVERNGRARVPEAIVRVLTADRVDVVLVDPGGAITGPAGRPLAVHPLSDKDLAALRAGASVSATRKVNGSRAYVEGRPLSNGGAVVLAQKVAAARSNEGGTRLRLVFGLGVGLLVAAGVGVVLARRLARPLQRAAAAAHRLSTGARDVRVEPAGPAEVAEVAEAINGLTAALSVSEGRQRDFLLSVSHELRTPLTAVKGYAEALADDVVPAEAVAPTGRVLLAESARLERLVSDLLDLARLGAQDFRIDATEVDLAELTRQAATVWADRCAREGVGFAAELPAGPVLVRTDPTRVRQIIDGLAENALRVTPSGRPIVFALRAEGDAGAVLQVRDGGPGLTDDDCQVAFDRAVLYQRYRGVRRVGTGVGLALVAGLARRLGGRAEAGRAPEGGACFSVYLPGGRGRPESGPLT